MVVFVSSRGERANSSGRMDCWRGEGVRCGTGKKDAGMKVSVPEFVADGM